MSLTQRQRVSLLDDLQADAARAADALAQLIAFVEQLRARIENARWGTEPNEQRRNLWVKAEDKATYKPRGKRK